MAVGCTYRELEKFKNSIKFLCLPIQKKYSWGERKLAFFQMFWRKRKFSGHSERASYILIHYRISRYLRLIVIQDTHLVVELIKGFLILSKAGIRIKGDIVANFALDTGLKHGSVFSLFGSIIDAWKDQLRDMGIQLRFMIGGDIFDVRALKKKSGHGVYDIGCLLICGRCFSLWFCE